MNRGQGRVHRRKRAPCWSYTAGAKGHTVTVYERVPGGPLQARCFDATMRDGRGGYRREALGHRERSRKGERRRTHLDTRPEDMFHYHVE